MFTHRCHGSPLRYQPLDISVLWGLAMGGTPRRQKAAEIIIEYKKNGTGKEGGDRGRGEGDRGTRRDGGRSTNDTNCTNRNNEDGLLRQKSSTTKHTKHTKKKKEPTVASDAANIGRRHPWYS
jgi:hypothetical protein